MNQQNTIPPAAHCRSTVAASRRITGGEGNRGPRGLRWLGHAVLCVPRPRRPRPTTPSRALSRSHRYDIVTMTPSRRLAAVAAAMLSVTLTACFTGERPRLVEGAATTGDPASDAVLARLEGIGDAVFTADYDLLTRFGDLHTAASVVQAEPGRRSITIGKVRFLLDGAEAATCDVGHGGVQHHHRRRTDEQHPARAGLLRQQRLRPAAARRRAPGRPDHRLVGDDRRPAGDVRDDPGGRRHHDLLRARQRPAGPTRRRRRRGHDDGLPAGGRRGPLRPRELNPVLSFGNDPNGPIPNDSSRCQTDTSE